VIINQRQSKSQVAYPIVGMINGKPVYRAEIPNVNRFQTAFKNQMQSQWCWAACVSNIFAYHNHPLAQKTIVKTVYGSEVNLPSFTARRIAEQLNRVWQDDNGKTFRATLTAAYDAVEHVYAINNSFLISEMKRGHPVIYCNQQHAMVITAVDFIDDQVVGVGVFDPWPQVINSRLLTGKEIVMVERGGTMIFLGSVILT